jgi:hypothetical protein
MPNASNSGAIAQADPENEIAAGQHVESGGFLGDMHRVERRQDQDIRPDRHALRVSRDVPHNRGDLQHLQRVGQPVVREPKGGEPGLPRRVHLRNHLRDTFGKVEALGKLRVDEKAYLHDGLLPPLASRSLILDLQTQIGKPPVTSLRRQ